MDKDKILELSRNENKDLFEKIDGRWMPKFEVDKEFTIP